MHYNFASMIQMSNTYNYIVNPENIDFKGHITVPSMCEYAVNAIGQNIRIEGYGVDVMKRERRAWVLLRSAFEIDQRPGLYEKFDITVWPVAGNGITYNRCVSFTNDKGQEIGRGTTEWCIIDLESRRPLFPELDLSGIDKCIPCRSPRRIKEFIPEAIESRKIVYSDCDLNGHLSNIRYVDMLYDMLPENIINSPAPVRLDINYRHEVRLGEKMSIGLKNNSNNEFLFIARNNEQTLCSARLQRA